MLPVIDKPFIVFIAALAVSFLESHGYLDPSLHNTDVQIAQTYAGDALGIITVIAWFLQHYHAQKLQVLNGAIEKDNTTVSINFSKLAIYWQKFVVFITSIYKKKEQEIQSQPNP